MGDAMRAVVLEQIASVLGTDPKTIPVDRKFTELGGDSLSAVRLRQACKAHHIALPVISILGSSSITSMLDLAVVEADTSESAPDLDDETSSSSGVIDAKTIKGGLPYDSNNSEPFSDSQIGESSAMTEIQLALIHGNQKNPSRNVINYAETYPWSALQRIRSAWETVVQIEPIFRTKFDLRGEGRLIELEKAAFIWNETEVYSREAYNTLRWSSPLSQTKDGPDCELMVGNRFDVITFHDSESGSSTSTIIWRIHHAVIDGYSAMIVLQKVRHATANLPIESGPSFAAFARDLHRLQKEHAPEGEAFWRRQYSKYPSAAGEPLLSAPSASQKDELEAVSFRVPVPELSSLARSSGVTFATLCYAAWAITMALYTDSDTVVFGAVLSGRDLPLPNVDRVVGPLMNTLPMHIAVDRSLSIAEFTRSVFNTLMALTPFQWTLPKHGYNRQFSSAISMQFDLQVDGSIHSISDLDPVTLPLEKPHLETRTDIPISIFVDIDGEIRLQFDTSLFKRHDIETLCKHYQAAFSTMLQPDVLIGECLDQVIALTARPLLRDMGNWDSSQTSFSSAKDDLVSLFDDTVAADPDAVAVEKGDDSITYHALDAAARKVASALREVIGEGEVVFLHADRSINWIIGIWGILKAGAVYCPIDPALPRVIRDANYEAAEATAFLGCVDMDRSFAPTSCDSFLAVQDILDSFGAEEEALPSRQCNIDPQASAYVCFTSGSSGKPKGVICTHAGLVAFQKDYEVRLKARSQWRVAQTMSVAFDGSIHEIFSALTHGAILVLTHSADPFAHLAKVDATILTPSAAKILDPDQFPNLKTVYLVGERVSQDVNDRWSCKKELYNMYGPTEGTGGATIKRLRPGYAVTIGRPNPSTRIYILSSKLALVPPGVVGEICLAGIQIARGYINLPQQTAKCFLPDSVCSELGETMYRTGDRGYWDVTTGEIVCLGRQDRQIKLRGFRVDLDDLEVRMLEANPAVTAVALTRQEDHLVAMITPESTDTASYASMVSTVLPPHAVPKHIVAVNQFPMTPAGKLDYKAVANAATMDIQQKPRTKKSLTPTENKLAAVWASVLGLDDSSSIDPNSAFIDLGGHSVLQLRLLTKLNQDFCRRFPFQLILESSTLSAMAVTLDRLLRETSAVPNRVLKQHTHTDDHALSPIEMEWWDKYELNQGSSAFNVCFAAQIDSRRVDRTRLASAWNIVLARHPILRSRYVKTRRTGVHRVYADCPPQVQWMSELDTWKEANRPFNLTKSDPIRIFLTSDTLAIIISHIVCDLTTFDLLTEEVTALYDGQDLPTAPGRYMDAIVSNTTLTPCHLDFWTRNLDNAPSQGTVFEAVADRVSYRGSSMLTEIPLDTFDAMLEVTASQSITMHQLLLAAVALTMQNDRDEIDIILGGPHLNRRSPEAWKAVGLFLEPLPIRIKSSKVFLNNASDFLKLVQDSSKQALAHSVPWNQLLQHLGVQVDYPNHPLFDIMVTFHDNLFQKVKALSALDPVMLWAEGSKFKLMFEFTVVSKGRLVLRIEHDSQCYPSSVVKTVASLLIKALNLLAEALSYEELRKQLVLT